MGKQAAMVFGVQWLGYTFAALFKTEKFYDMFGTGTFILVAITSHMHSIKTPRPTLRSDVVLALVCTWGIRLGGHLVVRIHKDGSDKRFDGVRTNPGIFYVYWTLQGVWVFITTLPISVLMYRPENWDAAKLMANDKLGILVWMIGFVVETIADWQKARFRSVDANKGEFISSGLWTHCRHPNCESAGGSSLLMSLISAQWCRSG